MSKQSELATYLRARRERLHPADVGLKDSGRRRTPGLRREEVATLAGVSIDYLVRLEQGRDLNPSPSVLAALAQALQLTDDERIHLATLAAIGNSSELCPTKTAIPETVAPTVQLLLQRLDPSPAFVTGPATDVLAWNSAWERLVEPLGLLDEPPPNLAWFVFNDPRSHTMFLDWSTVADEQVSRLRAAALRWGDDERFADLVSQLSDIPEFTVRWSTHDVSERNRGTNRIAHPVAGELRLSFEVLYLPDDIDQRLVTWFPADAESTAALNTALDQQLPVSPAHLRVVGQA